MKAHEESKKHSIREKEFLDDIKACKKRLNRKKTFQPARDDRAEHKPWRPGLQK